MDPEGGLISLLLSNGGGHKFLVSVLLLLSPEDLKACRQVNSTLNKLIKAEMWGTKTGRSKLVKDLVHRWKTAEPRPVMIPVTQWDPVTGYFEHDDVSSMFSNDRFLIVGQVWGKVSVFSLETNRWVKELMPNQPWGIGRQDPEPEVRGSADLVAVKAGFMVTVWRVPSTQMEDWKQVHSFDMSNHRCPDLACADWPKETEVPEGAVLFGNPNFAAMQVDKNKIILLFVCCSSEPRANRGNLIIMKMDEKKEWANRTLASFLYPSLLASGGDWVALMRKTRDLNVRDLKVSLWVGEETTPQDAVLPGRNGFRKNSRILLDPPFLILCLGKDSEMCVYKMENRLGKSKNKSDSV